MGPLQETVGQDSLRHHSSPAGPPWCLCSGQSQQQRMPLPSSPHSNPSFLLFFSFSPPKPCSALHDFLSNPTSSASAQFQTQAASVLSSSRAFSSKLLPSPISPSKQPCLLGKGRQNCVILIILELPWWPRQ